ncbi:MAG: class I SAM-dependent methyltransferase [Halobacteriota archaeon]
MGVKTANHKRECVAYYRNEAALYDEKRFFCRCAAIYNEIQQRIVYGYLKKCQTVLDAGTGTGRFALYLSRQGIDVIAIDSSKEMLLRAKRKALVDEHGRRINFIVADIEHLPFDSSVFDGICSIHVLVHLKNIHRVVEEYARVLKVDGILAVDIPSKILAEPYAFVTQLLGRRTYRDYFRTTKSTQNIFAKYSIRLSEKTKIVKMPRIIPHILMCRLKMKTVGEFLKYIETRYNWGSTSIVRAIKVK